MPDVPQPGEEFVLAAAFKASVESRLGRFSFILLKSWLHFFYFALFLTSSLFFCYFL